jgi:peptidyl-prolyl cis-trans isomerase B (cyclophilin B)
VRRVAAFGLVLALAAFGPRAPGSAAESTGAPRVAIDTALGRMVVDLLPDMAPRHVEQFLSLVHERFYDGTTFHRVIPGLLIQGGDPRSRDTTATDVGYGGLEDRRLSLEPSDVPFERGSVGMARDYRPDGASCQFFILLDRVEALDHRFTAFGRVTRGLEVAEKIARRSANAAGRPDTAITMTIVALGAAGAAQEARPLEPLTRMP